MARLSSPRFISKLVRLSQHGRPTMPRRLPDLNPRVRTAPLRNFFFSHSNISRTPSKLYGSSSNHARFRSFQILAAGGGLLTIVFSVAQPGSRGPAGVDLADEESIEGHTREAEVGEELPQYRILEIRNHGPKSARPWIIYEDKVYDITEWLPAHPGGEVILRSAGASIEPYWDIFSIHKTPYVREILEQYVIGKVHPDDLEDGRPRVDAVEDPFVADPERDARLRQLTCKPCNAETGGAELAANFLTPNEVFYVRNHMWVPVIEDPSGDTHGISIELPDGSVKTYTVGELKSRFEQHTVTSVLQCSGNRRRDMTEHARKTNGLQWGVGAISCAKWEGVRLRDVLADAGLAVDKISEDAQHVQFSALEAYGASIPIHAALDPRGDVLLAFKMNDSPLPPDHGFPVRVVVPGTVAARCVKWVNKIVISDEESSTTWQRRDYKCFGPNETQNLDWDKYKSIQEMPVTSAITRARLVSTHESAHLLPSTNISTRDVKRNSELIELEGYAYSGGGREIQRVDVSLDGGTTWGQATFLDDTHEDAGSKRWCWKRWTYYGPLPVVDPHTKTTTFVVKATDEAYNTQPQCYKSIYNLRGNLANAWHRLEVEVSPRSYNEQQGSNVAARTA